MSNYDQFKCVALESDVYIWENYPGHPVFWILRGKYGRLDKIRWPFRDMEEFQFVHVVNGKIFFGRRWGERHFYYPQFFNYVFFSLKIIPRFFFLFF